MRKAFSERGKSVQCSEKKCSVLRKVFSVQKKIVRCCEKCSAKDELFWAYMDLVNHYRRGHRYSLRKVLRLYGGGGTSKLFRVLEKRAEPASEMLDDRFS